MNENYYNIAVLSVVFAISIIIVSYELNRYKKERKQKELSLTKGRVVKVQISENGSAFVEIINVDFENRKITTDLGVFKFGQIIF